MQRLKLLHVVFSLRRFVVQRRLNERPEYPLVDCLYPLIDALKEFHRAFLEADIAWSGEVAAQVLSPGTVLLLTMCIPADSQDL